MVRKYIKRDFTDHEYSNQYLSDEDEYIKLEIFSFDPNYTKIFLPENNTLIGENAVKTSWRSASCYRSSDMIDPMEFTLDYTVKDNGLYRIDVVYEQNNQMYGDGIYKEYNTGKDLTGWYDIYVSGSKSEHKAKVITDSSKKNLPKTVQKEIEKAVANANKSNTSKSSSAIDLKFEGENNALKRKTIFKQLDKGDYKFEFGIPHNCFVMGFIVRKVLRFWGTNNDEAGTNLQFTKAKWTKSDMDKPCTLEATIGYDDSFECNLNRSGLYMDFMDECNLYVRNNDGIVERVFGGYVSTPLPDSDRKQITIHCADRLRDGEAKYILDCLLLQKGDSDVTEYRLPITFNKHSEVLAYLCKLYETTLNHNIDANYQVEGEIYQEGFHISFGKDKDVKKISVVNGQSTVNKNNILLRNNASSKKKQVFSLYTAKKPVDIAKYHSEEQPCNLHITYGLGNPKTEHKKKETQTVDVADSTAGSQKFSKCGVSADKKYIMAIGLPSASGETSQYGYKYYKRIYERVCPACGSTELVWDWHWTSGDYGYSSCRGNKEGGSAEGHVFCKGCDADWSIFGKPHGGTSKRLKGVNTLSKSSKSEAQKLKDGKMEGVVTKNSTINADDIFKAIKKASKGWTHSTGTGSTASYLEKHGVGDCWAWSDWISKQLKKYKVNHKIVQYKSGTANHRSVLYQNNKGKYVDFPYKDYGFPKGTYATSGSLKGKLIYHYKSGGRVNQAKVSGSTSKTQTVETTITEGFDKDNPFQAYLDIVYSTTGEAKSKKYHLYVDFTQQSTSDDSLTGLKPVWVNNSSKTITLKDIVGFIQGDKGNVPVYIHSISFITPVVKATQGDKNNDWYTFDKNTQDNSSRKMLLYSIAFNNQQGTDPSDLHACGKSINEVMQSTVEQAGYLVDMEYAEHRCDDKIHFKINNNVKPVFTATEGNNNNILEWGNISYDPANKLYNVSMCVFKRKNTEIYNYVDTRVSESIMKYQEQTTLITENEPIGEREAYWNARHNEEFNPELTYTFTITVFGKPNIHLKELLEITANAMKLNTLKECNSLTMTYDIKNKPVIQTEIGCGELAPDLQVKKNIKLLRDNAKTKSTAFFGTATAVTDNSIYEWDN